MQKETKVTLLMIVVTVAIIIGGLFMFSRPPKETPQERQKVNQEILIRSDSPKLSAPNEKVVMVEFGDFECPACAAYHTLVKQVMEENKDKLSLVFRHFPLSQHKNARPAAYAAEAAGKQGKFWEMYNKLYENQDSWVALSDPSEKFLEYAKEFGLDLSKFKEDASSSDIKSKVDRDYADGVVLGVNSTPSFYINNEKIVSPRSLQEFNSLILSAESDAEVSSSEIKTEEVKYHAHFDLKVYTSGTAVDFSQAKYQETKDNKLNPDIHFHDGNGKVVHVHKEGVTLGDLFNSFGLKVDGTLFVNGEKKDIANILSYSPKDLDRILITNLSSSGAALTKQIAEVSDDSCIYSEKCPERGKPPAEECVGGIGTDCEEQ